MTVTLMLLIAAVAVSSQQVPPPAQVTDLERYELDRQLVPDVSYGSVTNAYQAQADSKVLVIPGAEALSDEEMRVVVENMQIMSHIIGLKLDEANLNTWIRGASRNLGYWALSGSGVSDIESMYLEGFGALFMLNTDYSLVAPAEKAAAPKEEAKDKLWTDVRRSLTDPPERRAYSGALIDTGRTRTSALEYSEEVVNKLQETILQSLVHASNMSQLGDDEVIVVHVTGAPRMMQSQTDTDVPPAPEAAGAAGGVSGGRVLRGRTAVGLDAAPRVSRPARAVVGKPTHLVIRAPMSEIKDLANEAIDFEEFKEKVSVVIY